MGVVRREGGQEKGGKKSNNGNILYYSETLPVGWKKRGGDVDFWNDIYKNIKKTDKKASIELSAIGMSLSSYIPGRYEPTCMQVSGKTYWGSLKVEIHSYYFCGL